MTVEQPVEPDKESVDEWLLENTNSTPEGLEGAKEEAKETLEREAGDGE
jgi:hypothetical protein